MKWNLRLVAAQRGIWKAGELRRRLAREGLDISSGKMSKLWSGHPASVKLAELDVLCRVLECGVDDLLIPASVNRDHVPENDFTKREALSPAIENFGKRAGG